jgi:hypothetical protein
MKLKNLTKKIRRLEARLQKDAKKLAKLKRKRGAATAARAAKTKSKSRPFAGKAGKTVRASAPVKTTPRFAPKPRVQSAAAVQAPNGAKKVRKKLNLTPERRAQLAAAMKARWAAKRAAAATNPQTNSADPRFAQGDASQPQ